MILPYLELYVVQGDDIPHYIQFERMDYRWPRPLYEFPLDTQFLFRTEGNINIQKTNGAGIDFVPELRSLRIDFYSSDTQNIPRDTMIPYYIQATFPDGRRRTILQGDIQVDRVSLAPPPTIGTAGSNEETPNLPRAGARVRSLNQGRRAEGREQRNHGK